MQELLTALQDAGETGANVTQVQNNITSEQTRLTTLETRRDELEE